LPARRRRSQDQGSANPEQFDSFRLLLSDDAPENAMITFNCKQQQPTRQFLFALCLALFATAASAKESLVAQWGRYDQSFKSSVKYENPFQQCALKVTFVSPAGQTNVVDGFWDGGKTWRVRFSPGQPGRWSFRTSCSDKANVGLDNQSGEFLCTSPTGQGRFAQHGPIRVAKDGHHFEHADGSPFFWLADAAWNAPRLSTARDWVTYTQVRGGQNFSAVQWAAGTGTDIKKRSAFSDQNRVTIDPEYFQALDEKIEMMNRAGLLSVIAPLWGERATENMPEEQIAMLVRYMNARWGAYDVAWLLTLSENRNTRWISIGREVFGRAPHAPVILFPGALGSGFGEFRNEAWVDAFGFGLGQNMNGDSMEWLVAGPLGRESAKEPARPFINVLPPMENGLAAQGQERITANDVRRLAWWSLLLTPPAGVSYGAQDVATWNTSKQGKLPTWQLSLFLPAAKQMGHIAETCSSVNWWTLRPAPLSIANQPGRNAPQRFIASAANASKTLNLTYVPEDRSLEILLEALPGAPEIQWLNPRTGKKSAAVAVVGMRSCQLPTPDTGDWVLCVKSSK
jgi:uncharacterized protein DUF4038/uncharacterized protein DUF5060/collagenase-like protein with putative collagen-binding domain